MGTPIIATYGTMSCSKRALFSLFQGRSEPWVGGAAGKKNRRKKPRASYDTYGMDSELLPPSKRVLSLRMQQSSRPDSANSDDGRSVQAATERCPLLGGETAGPLHACQRLELQLSHVPWMQRSKIRPRWVACVAPCLAVSCC